MTSEELTLLDGEVDVVMEGNCVEFSVLSLCAFELEVRVWLCCVF